jgi:hypothetical protein
MCHQSATCRSLIIEPVFVAFSTESCHCHAYIAFAMNLLSFTSSSYIPCSVLHAGFFVQCLSDVNWRHKFYWHGFLCIKCSKRAQFDVNSIFSHITLRISSFSVRSCWFKRSVMRDCDKIKALAVKGLIIKQAVNPKYPVAHYLRACAVAGLN